MRDASLGGMTFRLTSPNFVPDRPLPVRQTSDGEDFSPGLDWGDPPAGTKSFALIVHDPDAPDPLAPRHDWVHWLLYDIPAKVRSLDEGMTRAALPDGTREGRNDWGTPGYRGPSPPTGRHRYFFELCALDRVLPDLGEPTRHDLEMAMKGHVLATARLMGTYARHGL
jgi:hypothetical protein